MRRQCSLALVSVLISLWLLGPSSASASGFYFGDNGAKAFAQGGAFTAQADDLTAMQHNPAGLAQLDGLQFLADLNLLHNEVTFLRQDPGFDPDNPSSLVKPTTNSTTVFLSPFFGVAYGLPVAGRALTLSLGVYAPPAQGRNGYAEPNYAKEDGAFVETPRKFAPQRYALINHDIFISYPTLSAAYAVHPRFQVGLSAQLVVSHFAIRQALFAGDAVGLNPQRLADEDPNYDVVASADLPGAVTVTGVLGVLAQATNWLSLGASFRPPIPIRATGKLDLTLGPVPQATTTIEGNSATLALTMPAEVRVGARVTLLDRRLGLNLDGVYQGWNSVDALRLTPNEVFLVQGTTRTAVAPFTIEKKWKASWSVRVGGSFDVLEYLTVHAGVLAETTAVNNASFTVDFPHPDRLFFTGGLSGKVGPVDLIAAFGYTPTSTVVVQQSDIRRAQTDPTVVAGSVGSGVYTVGGWVATVGLRAHFLAKPAVSTAR